LRKGVKMLQFSGGSRGFGYIRSFY
jgi:hypothetical protein